MDIDWLEAEMERLSALPVAELGVPMFLVPENLADPDALPQGDGEGMALSREFDEAVALLEARRGTLTARDLAAVIEVLAEHRMLDRPFSSIAGGGPAAS